VNGYLELLPRGMFTPYVGAGIGFVYNQITRSYVNTETLVMVRARRYPLARDWARARTTMWASP
jgi:opacity protein-like surface antigen